MKSISIGLLIALSAFGRAEETDPFETSSTNLTEAEIRALPADTKFEDIERRLRYYTGAAVAVSIISFDIEGQKGDECVMLFGEESKSLLCAWRVRDQSENPDEAIVLWPERFAGKKLSEVVIEFEKKKEANKSPETRTTSGPVSA